MDLLDDKALNSSVSAVLETLYDEQNVRVALLAPHTARKLVRESSDPDGEGILSGLTDSILVDLPFRSLLYESRKVQRLYYELDKKDPDLYGKSHTVNNALLLIDPIRLSHLLKSDMSQAQRALFMRCFSPRTWVIFLRLVSLGVGSKLRDLYSARTSKSISDSFLRDIEGLQVSLVDMTLQVSPCDPYDTPADIERAVLRGCKKIYAFAQHMKTTWGAHTDELPLLNDLIPYLNKCVSQIDSMLTDDSSFTFDEPIGPLSHYKDLSPMFNVKLPPSNCRRRFDVRNCLDSPRLNCLRNADPLGPDGDRPTPLNLGPAFENLRVKNNPEFMRVLQDIRKAVVSVATKSATFISLIKLKILEDRQKSFQNLGAFAFINNEVLRKGFASCNLDVREAVPLLLLSHCLEAYSIREWVMRFLVDARPEVVSPFLADESPLSVNSYGVKESAYFRTAGQTVPKLGDYFTLLPPELKQYMSSLLKAKAS